MALYSDLNMFSPTSRPLLEDEDAIHMAVANIINTYTGERLFNVEFGNGLNDVLFDVIDELSALEILSKLKTAIDRFETRVSLNAGMTEIIPVPDKNRYDVRLVLDLVGADSDEPLVFEGELRK